MKKVLFFLLFILCASISIPLGKKLRRALDNNTGMIKNTPFCKKFESDFIKILKVKKHQSVNRKPKNINKTLEYLIKEYKEKSNLQKNTGEILTKSLKYKCFKKEDTVCIESVKILIKSLYYTSKVYAHFSKELKNKRTTMADLIKLNEYEIKVQKYRDNSLDSFEKYCK